MFSRIGPTHRGWAQSHCGLLDLAVHGVDLILVGELAVPLVPEEASGSLTRKRCQELPWLEVDCVRTPDQGLLNMVPLRGIDSGSAGGVHELPLDA